MTFKSKSLLADRFVKRARSKMREVLKKFGRYYLLDQIAQGGMAEIYRARLTAADGAGRIIIIKRIQAGQGTNQEFVQMFRAEIKVTMGFNHPNIAQLYDFGEEQNQPYISMEWVDGKNLKQVLTRFIELKQTFPVEIAAYIIEQAACGLNYAHTFKDKISGEPLGIVHRDISPQNILISYEGSVKVIDFGIAKATNNSEETRAGVIKGKPAYLSPEQISGETLDNRCDIFAIGTVFWELLAGRKLFAGESDLAILKMIESCTSHVKPPSSVNPLVPKELDYIVMKCLMKQRDKRYQTAEELQRALHKFLNVYAPDFDPADLAYKAKDLFKEEIVEDRKRIQKLNDKVEQLLSYEQIHEGNTSLAPLGNLATPLPVEDSTRAFKPVEKVVYSPPTPEKVQLTRPRPNFAEQRKAPEQNLKKAKPKINSTKLKIALGSMAAGLTLYLFGSHLHMPSISMPTIQNPFASNRVSPVAPPATQPPPQPSAPERSTASIEDPMDQPTQAASRMIKLKINLTPAGGNPTLKLNGQKLDPRSPMALVSTDAPLELVVERPGYRSFRREFVVDSVQVGSLQEWDMDVALNPVNFGFLTLHTTPSAEVTIMIDGAPWVRRTPLENEKLPVGIYQVKLRNDIVGLEKNLTVQIKDGKVVNLDTRLEIKD